jgi:hypothetical protein
MIFERADLKRKENGRVTRTIRMYAERKLRAYTRDESTDATGVTNSRTVNNRDSKANGEVSSEELRQILNESEEYYR